MQWNKELCPFEWIKGKYDIEYLYEVSREFRKASYFCLTLLSESKSFKNLKQYFFFIQRVKIIIF